jgi:hypothetical protein
VRAFVSCPSTMAHESADNGLDRPREGCVNGDLKYIGLQTKADEVASFLPSWMSGVEMPPLSSGYRPRAACLSRSSPGVPRSVRGAPAR